MQEKIDDRLSWLTQHLGGTGDKLVIITTCLLHAGYFLLATLCILFLNAPLFTRLVLLILVPINAWSEIKFRSSLSYGSLSCLLTSALIGKYIFVPSVSSIKLFKEFFMSLISRSFEGTPRQGCGDIQFSRLFAVITNFSVLAANQHRDSHLPRTALIEKSYSFKTLHHFAVSYTNANETANCFFSF